jgi:hypothetical protein
MAKAEEVDIKVLTRAVRLVRRLPTAYKLLYVSYGIRRIVYPL